MGHEPPNAEWFEKGLLAAMEDTKQAATAAPIKADAPKATTEKEKQPVDSATKAPPEQESDKLLRNAKVYIDNQLYKQARERLENILSKYPDTAAAKEAKELLKKIATNE
jgi:TolA-binding protein